MHVALPSIFLVLTVQVGLAAGPLARLVESRAPFPPANHLNDVTYANGEFIAVGNHNTLLKSADGSDWEVVPLPESNDWESALHDGEQWQVFGPVTRATSRDGVSWTLSEARGEPSMVYLPDGTLAAIRSNSPHLSTDGFIWNSVRPTDMNSLAARGLATNGSRLVIVGRDGMILSSDDLGETWEVRLSGAIEGFTGRRNDFVGVRYDSGRFLAFGLSGLMMMSGDGIDWKLVPAPHNSNITDVITFKGKTYIVTGFSSPINATSDFETWETPIVRGSGELIHFAASDDRLVAVGEAGRISYSDDGVTWQEVEPEMRSGFVSGATNDNIILLGGYERSVRSVDGVTWEEIDALSGLSITSIAYGNDIFVSNADARAVRTSIDGITWDRHEISEAVIPDMISLKNLVFHQGRFVALTYTYNVIESDDGVHWRNLPRPPYDEESPSGTLRVVGERLAIAGGGTGTLFSSEDGLTWTQADVPTLSEFSSMRDIVYGNGVYLAVDNHTKFYTSPDLVTWTHQEGARVSGFVESFFFAEGFFHILARNSAYTSSTGELFYRLTLPIDTSPTLALARPHQIIFAGEGGEILSSPPPTEVGYEAWSTLSFSASTPAQAREREADPDGDGESNFEEYAFGNLPEDSSSFGVTTLPTVSRNRNGITRVDHIYLRNESRFQDGVRYKTEFSLDLKDWEELDPLNGYKSDADDGIRERVYFGGIDRDWPLLKEGQGYFRHRAVPAEDER